MFVLLGRVRIRFARMEDWCPKSGPPSPARRHCSRFRCAQGSLRTECRFSEIAPAGSHEASMSSASSTDQTPGLSGLSPLAACTIGRGGEHHECHQHRADHVFPSSTVTSSHSSPGWTTAAAVPGRFRGAAVGGIPSCLSHRPYVLRLVQLHREAARDLEVGDEAVAVVRDRVRELDALRLQLGDGLLDVVAVERDVVRAGAAPCFRGSAGWQPMSASGRSKISQPSPTSVAGKPSLSRRKARSASGSDE